MEQEPATVPLKPSLDPSQKRVGRRTWNPTVLEKKKLSERASLPVDLDSKSINPYSNSVFRTTHLGGRGM